MAEAKAECLPVPGQESSAETNSVFYERIFYRIVVYRTNEYSTILSLLISDVTNLYTWCTANCPGLDTKKKLPNNHDTDTLTFHKFPVTASLFLLLFLSCFTRAYEVQGCMSTGFLAWSCRTTLIGTQMVLLQFKTPTCRVLHKSRKGARCLLQSGTDVMKHLQVIVLPRC